jgi:hypothetical protein
MICPNLATPASAILLVCQSPSGWLANTISQDLEFDDAAVHHIDLNTVQRSEDITFGSTTAILQTRFVDRPFQRWVKRSAAR